MRITAALSPTSLRYLLVSGAVWSVLVVLCAAKHVENNPTALFSAPPPISQNNSEDCNGILCIIEDRAQLLGQDDIPNGDGSPKQAFEFDYIRQTARAKSQNENLERGKRSADVPVENDVQVLGSLDYEEERKITSDQTNWCHGHVHRQMHDESFNREQSLKSGDLQQPLKGKKYLEGQHSNLYFQLQKAKDYLEKLKDDYARYARNARNTTWDIAASKVSVNVAALPPPVRHLKPAIEDAKRCGSFPVLVTNRENKANISEGNFEYNNTENFVCLMSSTYEIVTVLTWLLDMVRLDLAMSPDTDGKSQVLYNLVEIISHDSPTLSSRLSNIRSITLSVMECLNRKPNNYVLVEILQCKLEDIGGPDHAVRGLQVIGLMDEYISILSQLKIFTKTRISKT